ncbi:MAG: hypothetical protein Q9187_002627 [Circinaria calcarea]
MSIKMRKSMAPEPGAGLATSNHSSARTSPEPDTPASPPLRKKKRKREDKAVEEIEVDIGAPEPPSKKALRKAKKGKITLPIKAVSPAVKRSTDEFRSELDEEPAEDASKPSNRSGHGIWIGNLPYSTTKASLTNFFTKDSATSESMITRIHMPAPNTNIIEAARQGIKPLNQGYAYVDFSNRECVVEAITMSEKLLLGRAVLIKDARSFEGRPEKLREHNYGESIAKSTGKPPSKRVFLGNLPFDTTEEELREQFSRCGEVVEVFVATFEDTGQCKGFAWVTFSELEAGIAAVRGWVNMEVTQDGGQGDSEAGEEQAEFTAKPKRMRKWWVNRIRGRTMRMEFAEDAATRYKKRHGKRGSATRKDSTGQDINPAAEDNIVASTVGTNGSAQTSKYSQTSKGYDRKKNSGFRSGMKIDARNIKPGAALAEAARLTGAIVESQGKKITFA